MTPVLSEAQLQRLGEHKYSVSGSSVTERVVLEVFWSWLVQKLPMWVAPNLLTIAGFLINVVTSLLVIFYSPTAKEEAPAWVYAVCAVGLFLYQCLDGMDGKQARRTGSSTPLGELFDHGCDAISSAFIVTAMGCAMKMGERPALLLGMLFAAQIVFYCVHWEACMSGTMHVGFIDVVEAQVLSILAQLISALVGPSFWSQEVPLFAVSLRVTGITPFCFVGLWRVSYTLWRALTGNAGKDNANNNNSSAAVPRAECPDQGRQVISERIARVLSTGFPIAFPIVLACITYGTSPELFLNHPCLYLLMFGLAIAKVTNKLIIAHITKSEMTALDSSMFGPGVLFLSQCSSGFVSLYIVLWVCLIFVTLDLALYCVSVCRQICDHLDIYCFCITSKPSQRRQELGPDTDYTR